MINLRAAVASWLRWWNLTWANYFRWNLCESTDHELHEGHLVLLSALGEFLILIDTFEPWNMML